VLLWHLKKEAVVFWIHKPDVKSNHIPEKSKVGEEMLSKPSVEPVAKKPPVTSSLQVVPKTEKLDSSSTVWLCWLCCKTLEVLNKQEELV